MKYKLEIITPVKTMTMQEGVEFSEEELEKMGSMWDTILNNTDYFKFEYPEGCVYVLPKKILRNSIVVITPIKEKK